MRNARGRGACTARGGLLHRRDNDSDYLEQSFSSDQQGGEINKVPSRQLQRCSLRTMHVFFAPSDKIPAQAAVGSAELLQIILIINQLYRATTPFIGGEVGTCIPQGSNFR